MTDTVEEIVESSPVPDEFQGNGSAETAGLGHHEQKPRLLLMGLKR